MLFMNVALVKNRLHHFKFTDVTMALGHVVIKFGRTLHQKKFDLNATSR